MSIRVKILLGCLSLTLVSLLLGLYSYGAQRQLGGLATRIYDDSAIGMSYLRSAENNLLRAEVQWRRHDESAGPDVTAAITIVVPDVLEDLEVARQRAMSATGRNSVDLLRQDLQRFSELRRDYGPATAMIDIERVEADFASAVEIYAADGYRYRRSVDAVVQRSGRRTGLAILVSLLAGLVITTLLGRSIVPALRKAVVLAQAIASGRLDNAIEVRGQGETARLLRALAAMQDSIRDLMAQQVRTHAGELAAQHARLEAALDNMSQGLCLFGAEGRLAVSNQRFAEMFGMPEPGATPDRVLHGQMLAPLRGADASLPCASFSCVLPDGRAIAVRHRPVSGGGWVATYEDVTEQRAADAKLVHMARHDALTGLPNRLLLGEHLQGALARARRDGGMAVLCLDLDRFKAVNDTLGHAAGDALLRAVSQRLRDCIRETDLVARLGGDEFAIVQEPATQPEDATALAQRLIEALSVPFDVDRQLVLVGTSIGIALSSEGTTEVDALLKRADLALYRAKADGRGNFRFFEPEMDVQAQARRALEADLRLALAADEFEVFYQPLVGVETGRIGGFEALLRWRHPVRGLVSPAIFIPLAEESGLIVALGEWVLRRACADAACWPSALKVAVNLSPAQFHGSGLTVQVADALAASGLPARRLELEITESVLLQDDQAVLTTLHGLRARGVRIAMDDFGTGYSSLSYLHRFPFDKIKIDQSFVRGMAEHEGCSAIVRAIIGLGRSLGIAVNAEGVETADQLATLRAEGCGEVQGYLFSPPKPVGDVAALLHRYGSEGDAEAVGVAEQC